MLACCWAAVRPMPETCSTMSAPCWQSRCHQNQPAIPRIIAGPCCTANADQERGLTGHEDSLLADQRTGLTSRAQCSATLLLPVVRSLETSACCQDSIHLGRVTERQPLANWDLHGAVSVAMEQHARSTSHSRRYPARRPLAPAPSRCSRPPWSKLRCQLRPMCQATLR